MSIPSKSPVLYEGLGFLYFLASYIGENSSVHNIIYWNKYMDPGLLNFAVKKDRLKCYFKFLFFFFFF